MSSATPHIRLVQPTSEGRGGSSAAVQPEHILVAIPALNEVDHIEACLESLMAGDPRLQQIRFIVADGGSTDGTRELLDRLAARHANVEWIDNPRRLQSAAVNAIAARAEGETILVRCDAHSIYPPGYVTQVADALVQRDVASLVVPMDAVGDTCFQKANAWIVDTPLGSGGSAHRGGRESKFVDHGHHAGFRLEMFRKVGGYDETFSHNEDAEYDARVAAAGGRVFLDAGIRLAYKPRATVRALARQYFNYGKGRARTIRKHSIRPRLRQLFPVLSLAALGASALLAPFSVLGWLYPVLYMGILLAVSVAIAVRKRSVCGLLCAPAAATMHIAWALGFLRQWLFSR